MEITNINQLDLSKTYSYADYLLWKIKERVELFKGKILKIIIVKTKCPKFQNKMSKKIKSNPINWVAFLMGF